MAQPENHTLPLSLQGKVALVTGSSSGLGATMAREFSRRGCSVIITYPNKAEEHLAEDVVHSLEGDSASLLVMADLSTTDGPSKLAQAAAARFGTVDFLVNNAGVAALDEIDAMSDDDILKTWDRVVNVNGRGTMLLTRAILPILSRQNSRIINIGSATSRDPDPDLTIYAGSKGMIEAFTRCWARYFPRKYGCTVNTVAPGPTTTEKIMSMPSDFLDVVHARCDNIPVAPRMGNPNDLAWVVATLCEEKAGWLNGLYIPVAGGGLLT